MPLQDLTPQLRTRLSRLERAVGWFVALATVILLAGFGYYVYHVAERKGWFKTKIDYDTSLNNAAGVKVGDPVKLMGYSVGEITDIIPNKPWEYYGVTVYFRVKDPYYGYIWTDSQVRAAPSDFLGNRYLEILKGREGAPTVLETNNEIRVLNWELLYGKNGFFQELQKSLSTNLDYSDFDEQELRSEATNQLDALIKAQPAKFYFDRAEVKPFWLQPVEGPALAERLETLANTVEGAMPNILKLTNQVAGVLTNASAAAARLDSTILQAQPLLSNLTMISSNLTQTNGSLGYWLLPPELRDHLERTLASANDALQTAHSTLDNTDTNLTRLATSLDHSLVNLANITSNLNSQVQANTNLISSLSKAIVDTDDLVQGLKHHWLLRSAFKNKKPAPQQKPASGNP